MSCLVLDYERSKVRWRRQRRAGAGLVTSVRSQARICSVLAAAPLLYGVLYAMHFSAFV